MKVALAGGASPRSRVTARARVSMPRGGLDRDHLSALEEVGPAVHLRGLDPELRQDRGHLRAMLGAVVDCLQQEQRHGHPPRARRVITGHLDLAVLAGLRRRLLELCVAVSEPLRQGLEPWERVLREPLGPLGVQEPSRVPLLGVCDVDQGGADVPVGPGRRGTELLGRELPTSLHQLPIHHGVVPEELHEEIHARHLSQPS